MTTTTTTPATTATAAQQTVLTGDEVDAQVAAAAWQLHETIVALKSEITRRSLQLGRALGLLRDERLYVALGYDTFEAYLASPEVTISRTQAYRVIALVEGVERLPDAALDTAALEAMGVSRAEIALPLIRAAATEEERAAWVADAQTLSVRDLRERVREQRTGPPALAEAAAEVDRREMLAAVARRIGRLAAQLPNARHPRQQRQLLRLIADACRKAAQALPADDADVRAG